MSKNIFVSDFDESQNLKSLGHKDFKIWISSKSETKNFGQPTPVFGHTNGQKKHCAPPKEKKIVPCFEAFMSVILIFKECNTFTFEFKDEIIKPCTAAWQIQNSSHISSFSFAILEIFWISLWFMDF